MKPILLIICLFLVMNGFCQDYIQAIEKESNIYIVGSDSNTKQVTFTGNDYNPSLSPDGRTIYFIRKTGNMGEHEYEGIEALAIMKVDAITLYESMVTNKNNGLELYEAGNLTLTPDGKYLLFVDAKWVTSGVLIRVNTKNYNQVEISPAMSYELIREGQFKNHIIVLKGYVKKNVGRDLYYWLIDIDGNAIKELGSEKGMEAFKQAVLK